MAVGFVNGRYPQFLGILVRQFWEAMYFGQTHPYDSDKWIDEDPNMTMAS
jgi:hypothetical protein